MPVPMMVLRLTCSAFWVDVRLLEINGRWIASGGATFVLTLMVGAKGFEPSTPCTPCRCATRLRYAPTELAIIPTVQDAGPSNCLISSSSWRSAEGSSGASGVEVEAAAVLFTARAGARGSEFSFSRRCRAPLIVNPCS
jgi:hypothetical protein